MSYQDQLSPWVIYRAYKAHQIPVARFRRRSDAQEYLKAIRRLLPYTEFTIGFDTNQECK